MPVSPVYFTKWVAGGKCKVNLLIIEELQCSIAIAEASVVLKYKHMDIVKALSAVKQLERKIGDLYRHFYRLYSSDRETAGLFYLLAQEEDSHADIVDYQLRIARKNPGIFTDVEMDTEPLDKMMARVDSTIALGEKITINEAVLFSSAIESSAMEYHYRELIKNSNPDIGVFLQSLGDADKEHAEKLRAFAKACGCL